MSVKFANNASTALDGALTNSATSFDVVDASVFPAIASPDFCFLTIVEGSSLEIIKVTDITGNTLTATRGQDGTSGVAFSSGARIDLRMTKAMLDELHGSVAVSANDTSPGRLLDKLTEGAGITLTENNDGANEDIEVGVDPDAVVTKTATTGSALVAVGTTAQRDASPTEGGIRGNSDDGVFEGYIGGSWFQFGDLLATNNLDDVSDPTTARQNLGLEIDVDVQGYDAAISKTDTAETRSATINMADYEFIRAKLKDYGETVNIIGSIGGGTQDIDLTLGNVVTGTVDTSTTTFTFSNPSASGSCCSFTLVLVNGGSQTVNWPASVDWPDGSAPALTSSGVDILTFFTVNGGTTWYGFLAGKGMA